MSHIVIPPTPGEADRRRTCVPADPAHDKRAGPTLRALTNTDDDTGSDTGRDTASDTTNLTAEKRPLAVHI